MKSYVILIIAVVVLTLSCSEGVTESRERIIRAPQDMIWTADTLKGLDQYAQLLPRNLLVFSANDAWLTCWSDIARGLIWHFDGKTWNESNITKDVGGMRIQDANGYSSSDLWACGYTGDEIFLAHYDGSRWAKYNTNGIKGELIKMCKDTDGNLWAGGRNGVIMKYDKTRWISDRIYIPITVDASYFIKGIEYYNGKIHTIITSTNKKTLDATYYYATGNINNWTLVDSIKMDFKNPQMKWGYFKFFTGQNMNLYTVGLHGCWKYNNTSWENIIFYNGELYDLSGISDNYLITCSAFKILKFFDGTVWLDFSSSLNVSDPQFVFRNVWTNGYETIIAGFTGEGKLVVWRGK